MSFRGRGWGRGRFGGGGSFGFAKQEEFEEFPKIELPDPKAVKLERDLIFTHNRLTKFWNSSAYHLERTVSTKSEVVDIETFSGRGKRKIAPERDSLDAFVQLVPENIPKELIGGAIRRRPPKKVRWNPHLGMQKLDLLEKLEKKYEGQEEKGDKQKKEGEEEEEDDDEEAEEAEEDFSDDDYNQNVDFDDDEDDFNMGDDEDEEPIY